MSAAGVAALDPARGRIVGWVAPQGGRPAKVRLLLDGAVVAETIAARNRKPIAAPALASSPPSPNCWFELRLPRGARGTALSVEAGGAAILNETVENDRALARYREGTEMADSLSLEDLRFRGGSFSARLRAPAGGAAPDIALRVLGDPVGRAKLSAVSDGIWDLVAPVPRETLSEGVTTIEFVAGDGSVLAVYPIRAGAPPEGDVKGELASLRAELDQLKRSVREALAGGVIRRDERPLIVAEALTEMDALLELRARAARGAKRKVETDDWEDDDSWEIVE